MFTTKAAASEFIGGLSKPSKMPGKSFGISAELCPTGSVLRDIEGSTCHKCYALKGAYTWHSTVTAHDRRYSKLVEALRDTFTRDSWIAAMVRLMRDEEYFRWHDSGDLQNVQHLEMIVAVVRQTPDTKHWLPTREYSIVREFLRTNTRPKNLIIRLSAQMIDAAPPAGFEHTSTVHKTGEAYGWDCPSRFQDNKCGPCRACWDEEVFNVGYYAH